MKKRDRIVLDTQDKRLLAVMTEDGQQGAGAISEKLGVTSPTVRSRLKNLIKSEAMRIRGLVDPFRIKGLEVALVGINVETHSTMDDMLERLAALDKINWVAVVTGRYDIVAEVVLLEGTDDLYDFINLDLTGIGGISSSESFVIMKGKRKWIPLPKALRQRFLAE